MKRFIYNSGRKVFVYNGEFKEEDHPRGEDGKFGGGGGPSKSGDKASRKYESTPMSADDIDPPHEVREEDKLSDLVEKMKEKGWEGRPVLAIDLGDGRAQAVTGSHRIAAAREAGIEVPVMKITENDLDSAADKSGLEGDERYQFKSDLLDKITSAEDDDKVLEALKESGMKDAFDLMQEEVEKNQESEKDNSVSTRIYRHYRASCPDSPRLTSGQKLGREAPRRFIYQANP